MEISKIIYRSLFTDCEQKIYVKRDRSTVIAVGLCLVVAITIFAVFKWFYPYPNFSPDSYSYIETAFYNYFISIWPTGYSKFLRLVSCFSFSHNFLVWTQYLLVESSLLYFIVSLSSLFGLSGTVRNVLLAANLLNPINLYVSNFISSDALFTSLSLIWLTQLFWILHSPSKRLLLTHAIVLVLAFCVRYNALYYPFISLAVILFKKAAWKQKLLGAVAIVGLVSLFVVLTIGEYIRVTKTPQFSAFGGWQLANNALYAYGEVPNLPVKDVPEEFRVIHSIANRFKDSVRQEKYAPYDHVGSYFLWDEKSPLGVYIRAKYQNDSTTKGFARWASVAPLYGAYGTYLITHYPLSYTENYIWPNLKNYYLPASEFLSWYNMSRDTIEPIAEQWFHLRSKKVFTRANEKGWTIAKFYPVLLCTINGFFVIALIGFLMLNGFSKAVPSFTIVLRWVFIIWICNNVFSVLASPIVLRYQLFAQVLSLTSSILLLSFIIRESRSEGEKVGELTDHIKVDSPVGYQKIVT